MGTIRTFLRRGLLGGLLALPLHASAADLQGRHYSGQGEASELHLLETCRRLFHPDPELPSVSMLYSPWWNGFVEGPTWDAWWIQNSYGTTYSILPFLEDPYLKFLRNSHELWFSQMGDGRRAGTHGWVAPDGCLCDCARPGDIMYRQGDGRTDIHDWGMEFTAAGVLMQAELLLIGRETEDLAANLPRLERSVAFLESRRDPANNLFLAGPAGNLLAPSYAGWAKPDGTYGQAYLAGLSVTYIAALDRMIEVEKLAGRPVEADRYRQWRDRARLGLAHLTTEDGYLIRSLDPDGTRHGVFGAPKHGYLETSPNQDAIAFRVVEQSQAEQIYRRIASIPELRPHSVIIPNYPSYDDLYTKAEGLWEFGTWVNGGHWSTCEARMILAYLRLGRHTDARRSLEHLLPFARRFRFDNPLTEFGKSLYQPGQPVNIVYDSFGPPAALLRGLFEYLYSADSLTLIPHVPPGLTELVQHDPVRFGSKRIYLASRGQGPITAVTINGQPSLAFDWTSASLAWAALPEKAYVWIGLGGAALPADHDPSAWRSAPPARPSARRMHSPAGRYYAPILERFLAELNLSPGSTTYLASHVQLALDALRVAEQREDLLRRGELQPPPPPASGESERLYYESATRLVDGLDRHLASITTGPLAGASRFWQESVNSASFRQIDLAPSDVASSSGMVILNGPEALPVLSREPSRPPEQPVWAELQLDLPAESLAELWLHYAAPESRPLKLMANGALMTNNLALERTAAEGQPLRLAWRRQCVVPLKQGRNSLRFESSKAIPQMAGVRLLIQSPPRERLP